MRDAVYDLCRRAGIPSQREVDVGIVSEDGKQLWPADLMGLRVGGELDPEPALALGDDLLVGAVVGGGLVEEQGAEVGELEGGHIVV